MKSIIAVLYLCGSLAHAASQSVLTYLSQGHSRARQGTMGMRFIWPLKSLFAVLLLTFFSITSLASFGLDVQRVKSAGGANYFCYSPMAMAIGTEGKTKCLTIVDTPALQIKTNETDAKYRFTSLSINEISLGTSNDPKISPSEKILEVTLIWKGRGAGTLAIEGPQGSLLIFGKVTNDTNNKTIPYNRLITSLMSI